MDRSGKCMVVVCICICFAVVGSTHECQLNTFYIRFFVTQLACKSAVGGQKNPDKKSYMDVDDDFFVVLLFAQWSRHFV